MHQVRPWVLSASKIQQSNANRIQFVFSATKERIFLVPTTFMSQQLSKVRMKRKTVFDWKLTESDYFLGLRYKRLGVHSDGDEPFLLSTQSLPFPRPRPSIDTYDADDGVQLMSYDVGPH